MQSETLKCINLQMLKASHLVLKTYDDAYRPYGIKATQLPVLNVIASQGPVTIKHIAREVQSERSVLSRKLAVMQKNGWVEELDNAGREKSFKLTDKGQELLTRVTPVREQVQEDLLGKLSSSEQQLMLTLCDKLQQS